jgi:citronellol/citronellal dehydrogenase
MPFKNRTVLITGATRGIGKAIAIKLAKEGANIIIAAKSVTEDPRLGGTIYSAAAEVEAAGGKCLAVQVDIRFEDQIEAAIAKAVETFGGIDVVINNASAIQLTGTEQTESKKFDLIHSINVRGTFLVVKHALPYLKKGNNPHILTLSPPINMDPRWLGPHVAYTISKFNMSMLAIGWAQEFKSADEISQVNLFNHGFKMIKILYFFTCQKNKFLTKDFRDIKITDYNYLLTDINSN